jgi:hypothetical protein
MPGNCARTICTWGTGWYASASRRCCRRSRSRSPSRLESFTTVYSRPSGFAASFFFSLCLLAVPAIVLASWVRNTLIYVFGVTVFVVQAVGIAVQIAKTDDPQAGLNAFNLPFYTGAVAVLLVGIDVYLRYRRRPTARDDDFDLYDEESGELVV